MTFARKRDAEAFKQLLNHHAVSKYDAVIIRREMTEGGYIPTYGEKNVPKN